MRFVQRILMAVSTMMGGACAPQSSTAEVPPQAALPDRDSQLAHRLVEKEGALLLDVRSQAEYEAEHLDGAVWIPHDQVGARLDEVEKLVEGDKSRAIVVYCASGNRAGKAKQTLVKAGYRVTNLGGMSDW